MQLQTKLCNNLAKTSSNTPALQATTNSIITTLSSQANSNLRGLEAGTDIQISSSTRAHKVNIGFERKAHITYEFTTQTLT